MPERVDLRLVQSICEFVNTKRESVPTAWHHRIAFERLFGEAPGYQFLFRSNPIDWRLTE